jgi:hypothetical protein
VAAPALGDVDGDGDLDALLGYDDGTFRYVENAVVRPVRIGLGPLVGAPDPFAGHSGGAYETPALGDLDGDGDRDLVAGSSLGDLRFYENTGNAETARFQARTGSANPLPALLGTNSAPTLGDVDGDGDLDLIAVDHSGAIGMFHYYANTGSAIAAAFALQTGAQDPLATLAPGRNAAPAIGDVDLDGDLDLITGRDEPTVLSGGFSYFQNTGSATSPSFVERTGAANPLGSKVAELRSAPALGNIDYDRGLELVVGSSGGTFTVYNLTSNSSSTLLGSSDPLNGVDLGQRAAPALGSLDGYGSDDLVAGSSSGYRAYLLPEPRRSLLFAAGVALLSLLARFIPGAARARTSGTPRTRSAR